MTRSFFFTALVSTAFITVSAQSTPRLVADELLAADRAFAMAARQTDIVTALTTMFAPDIVLTHAGGIAYGRDKAIEALKASPINAGARIEWTPARVSVSGDGRHGFTAGFMTLHRLHPTTQSPRRGDPGADKTTTPLKYLGYWEKQQDGWRLLAYKRGIAKTPAPAMAVSYVLPRQIVTPATDATTFERYRESLAEAERSFSRDAQTIGIGPAFKQYGDPEAINLGGPDVATWLLGNEQVATGVGSGAPLNTSPVSWGPEKTIVAASGDFGVTIGYIVSNKPGPDGKIPPGQPFFTIWKRSSPKDPWLYIAE
ncbi:MAG: nuclear transport factor 2 family protein [Vicinamibacterales bacterium]